jgi:hypothetical protein
LSVHRDKVDQARSNMLKVIRVAVRLRHSIAADEELNELLPKAEAKFNAAVMRGQLPEPLDIKKSLGIQ